MRVFGAWFMYLVLIFTSVSCQQQQGSSTSNYMNPETKFTANEEDSPKTMTMYDSEIKHGFDLKLIAYFDTQSELSHTYAQKLSELRASLGDASVFYTIVFPKKGETARDIQQFISENQLQEVEFYNDPEYLMTDFTGATSMPQFFVLDSLSKPVYQGAFDAAGEVGANGDTTRNYLFESIKSYLKGEEPETTITQPLGLAIRKTDDPV